jgi:NADH-quinone oxidoreductase subunit J
MLLGAERLSTGPVLTWQRPAAFVLGGILLVEAIYVILFRSGPATEAVAASASFGTPEAIGDLLFSTYLLPFEIISILLLAAMVGAIVLTKKRKQNG